MERNDKRSYYEDWRGNRQSVSYSGIGAAYQVGDAVIPGVDVALSVTGIAGPEGGSEEKPVGTVWTGLALGEEETGLHRIYHGHETLHFRISGNRVAGA